MIKILHNQEYCDQRWIWMDIFLITPWDTAVIVKAH